MLINGAGRRTSPESYLRRMTTRVNAPYIVSTIQSFELFEDAREDLSNTILDYSTGNLKEVLRLFADELRILEESTLQSYSNSLGFSSPDEMIREMNAFASDSNKVFLTREAQFEIKNSTLSAHMTTKMARAVAANLQNELGDRETINIKDVLGDVDLRNHLRRSEEYTKGAIETLYNAIEELASDGSLNQMMKNDRGRQSLEQLIYLAEAQRQIGNELGITDLKPFSQAILNRTYKSNYMNRIGAALADVYGVDFMKNFLGQFTESVQNDETHVEKTRKEISRLAKDTIKAELLSKGGPNTSRAIDLEIQFNSDFPTLAVDVHAGLETRSKVRGSYSLQLRDIDFKKALSEMLETMPQDLRNYYLTILMNIYLYGDLFLTREEQTSLLRFILSDRKNFNKYFKGGDMINKFPTLVQTGAGFRRFSDAVRGMAEAEFLSGWDSRPSLSFENARTGFENPYDTYMKKVTGFRGDGRALAIVNARMEIVRNNLFKQMFESKDTRTVTIRMNLNAYMGSA